MRDIVHRIDEILPFIAGAIAGTGKKMGRSGKDEELSRLIRLAVYHPKESDWKKAAELVIKQERVNKIYAKKLRKFFKNKG